MLVNEFTIDALFIISLAPKINVIVDFEGICIFVMEF